MKGRVCGRQSDDARWQMVVANFSGENAFAWKVGFYAFLSADIHEIQGDGDGTRG